MQKHEEAMQQLPSKAKSTTKGLSNNEEEEISNIEF
jgi:hypothetical protein